jgi:hypothetical protein
MRADLIVYPAALTGWEVRVSAVDETRYFDKRAEALAYAHRIAVAERPCKIHIEDWFGHLCCEWAFDENREFCDALDDEFETDSARIVARMSNHVGSRE